MRKAMILMLVSLCCVGTFSAGASCNSSVKLDVSSSKLVGSVLIGDGLALIPVTWDGMWEIGEKDGIKVIQGAPENNQSSSRDTNHYFYFGIDEFLKPEPFSGKATITIVYYDGRFSQCALDYDSNGDNKYKRAGGTISGRGTGEWKTFSWTITDAGFYGRENGGADFRLYVKHGMLPQGIEDITVLIREISVTFE